MINTKKYIKQSCIDAIAAGSGIAVGKLIGKPGNHNYSIFGKDWTIGIQHPREP